MSALGWQGKGWPVPVIAVAMAMAIAMAVAVLPSVFVQSVAGWG